MSVAKAQLEGDRDWDLLIGQNPVKAVEKETNCSPPSICFDKLVKGDIISHASKILKILQAPGFNSM